MGHRDDRREERQKNDERAVLREDEQQRRVKGNDTDGDDARTPDEIAPNRMAPAYGDDSGLREDQRREVHPPDQFQAAILRK